MYLFSLYLSRYVNWCQAVLKQTPRWKINLAGLLFFFDDRHSHYCGARKNSVANSLSCRGSNQRVL